MMSGVGHSVKKINEYYQEIQEPQTQDPPTAQ